MIKIILILFGICLSKRVLILSDIHGDPDSNNTISKWGSDPSFIYLDVIFKFCNHYIFLNILRHF